MHNQRIIMTNNVRSGSATPPPHSHAVLDQILPGRVKSVLQGVQNLFTRAVEPLAERMPEGIQNLTSGIPAPVEWSRPPAAPTEALKKIEGAAKIGLKNTQKIGTSFERSAAPALHGKIEARLTELKKNDPKPDPRAAEEAKAIIESKRKTLCAKISALTVLMQMLSQCGREEKDFTKLLKLVKTATETRQSIWDLFVEAYSPSLKEKMEAGLVYWLYYKSALIEKGINAYLGDLIEGVVNILSDPKEAVFSPLLRSILDNTDDFLVEDKKATESFANQIGSGSLKERREKAIREKYGSEEDLCKRCSEAIMRKLSPRIPIFEELHNVRLVGWIFKKFSGLVNRFIISKAMNSFILPMIFKKGLDKGLQFTHPDYLPFKINITRFLQEQVTALGESSGKEKQPPSNQPLQRFPGAERLPTMVANLLAVLNLEEDETANPAILGTSEAIKGRIRKATIDQYNPFYFLITPKFEGSIVESCHLLFAHLKKTAKNGELFKQLLDLSIRSFEPPADTTKDLEADLKVEKKLLDKAVDKVINKIIQEKVDEAFEGPNPESSRELAAASFRKQQIVIEEVSKSLNLVCKEIGNKVQKASQTPLTNNIQTEIISSLQIIQALASREELEDKLENVKTADQTAVWTVVTPILENIEKVNTSLLHLQKLQLNYSTSAQVSHSYGEIHNSLNSIEKDLQKDTRHFNPTPDAVEKELQKVKKALGEENPDYLKGAQLIEDIQTSLKPLTQEQSAIDSLTQCDHWAKQYIAKDANSKKECLKEINKQLDFLSAAEKAHLKALMGPKGSTLFQNRQKFRQAIDEMIRGHKVIQTKEHPKFKQALEKAITWTRETAEEFAIAGKADYLALETETRGLLSNVADLEKQTESLTLSLSKSSVLLEPRVLLGSAAGAATKPLAQPWVNNLAKNLFKKAYAFMFKERIYQAMFTRTMLEVAKLR